MRLTRTAARLHDTIATAGVSITGVSIGVPGNKATYLVSPESAQAAAQPTIDAFDDSAVAQAAWEAARVPERKDIRDQAAQAIADLDAFLALSSPTNPQILAVIKKLCRQNKRIIARLIQVD